MSEPFPSTEYFRSVVMTRRPYLTPAMITEVLRNATVRRAQPDGRLRLWGPVPGSPGRVLRVVLLADGLTVHNAFFDRSAPDEAKGSA